MARSGKRSELPVDSVLAARHLVRELEDLSRAHGLDHKQHAERPRPHGQQALFQRGWRPVTGAAVVGVAAARR